MIQGRVGIIDDHPAIILGTTSIVNAHPALVVTGAGASVAELLASGATYDVLLLDLILADGSRPADNVAAFVSRGIPVLAYTSGDRPELVQEAGRAGAIGVIRKSEPPKRLIAAIQAALRGEVVASPDWAAAIDTDDEFVTAQLTAREAEVLALYASGETAERVARRLYISRVTVIDHIRRIRAKYVAVDRPANSKIDLYLRAVEDGIIRT
ncbi:MAG: response regulator transcription factor [Propionibacteriaceae bacterium]|nr:response regulator transcription factor [Propionibacteriaceae bacterium]